MGALSRADQIIFQRNFNRVGGQGGILDTGIVEISDMSLNREIRKSKRHIGEGVCALLIFSKLLLLTSFVYMSTRIYAYYIYLEHKTEIDENDFYYFYANAINLISLVHSVFTVWLAFMLETQLFCRSRKGN